MKAEIDELCAQIQQEFGKDALIYKEESLTMAQQLALWSKTNILFITTLRDGQCLTPLEYITVRKQTKQETRSAVVLSEFSGCNESLGGVIKINPFNVDVIARELNFAIQMSGVQKSKRINVAS